MSDEDLLIAGGKRYLKQKRWAKNKNINARTVERYRQKGLPWLSWGNEIYIPETKGDEFIVRQVVRRNPPRKQRQSAEISP
jgi:hypothetical protein